MINSIDSKTVDIKIVDIKDLKQIEIGSESRGGWPLASLGTTESEVEGFGDRVGRVVHRLPVWSCPRPPRGGSC